MSKFKNVYWIGGSPCSGKSSIAELIAKEYGFEYYKCDDRLDEYLERGSNKGVDIMKKFASMSIDEIWLRDVESQVDDEFSFYREAFKFIEEDLEKISNKNPVIVEGAAILPEIVLARGIDSKKYICIVPTKGFQLEKYSQRGWVNEYLKECSNPTQAFENWMERDVQFALQVRADALHGGLELIVVDGSRSIEENYKHTKAHFCL